MFCLVLSFSYLTEIANFDSVFAERHFVIKLFGNWCLQLLARVSKLDISFLLNLRLLNHTQNVRPTTSIPLHHWVSDNAVPLQVLLQQQLAVQGTPHWLPDLCTHFLQDSGLVQVRRRQEEGRSTPLTTSPISHERVQ